MAVLHRLEAVRERGRVVLYVQSRVRPDWSGLPEGILLDIGDEIENPGVKSMDAVLAGLQPGTRLVFRLRANATKKIDTKSGPGGEKNNGQRVPLRGEEAKVAWLRRRGMSGGFAIAELRPGVAEVNVIDEADTTGRHPKGGLTFSGTVFEGTLLVKDPVRFRETLERGIGPGKAFGYGLLSVMPVQA
jgi:CRISPR system Cascade subunit CasE